MAAINWRNVSGKAAGAGRVTEAASTPMPAAPTRSCPGSPATCRSCPLLPGPALLSAAPARSCPGQPCYPPLLALLTYAAARCSCHKFAKSISNILTLIIKNLWVKWVKYVKPDTELSQGKVSRVSSQQVWNRKCILVDILNLPSRPACNPDLTNHRRKAPPIRQPCKHIILVVVCCAATLHIGLCVF